MAIQFGEGMTAKMFLPRLGKDRAKSFRFWKNVLSEQKNIFKL